MTPWWAGARRSESSTMCMGCGKAETYERWLGKWDSLGVCRCPSCGTKMKVMHGFDDGETEWEIGGRWLMPRGDGCMSVYGDLG